MTKVEAKEGESVDVLIRKFNKKVLSDGILNELKNIEIHFPMHVFIKRDYIS